MADPFRVEPKGKSWADIVEEDEQSDLLNSQHEECSLAFKEEESNEESNAAPQDATPSASSADHQADSNKEEQPAKKPILTGSRASKWASAPDEPREQTKWQSTASFKTGSMASKWANAPESPSRSRYDSNRQTRNDAYNRSGANDGRNTDLPRNNRWREDPPSGGRLNRSAFEDEDSRNGGFSNKANFSREKRHQEYHELTNKEVVRDVAPEHKKAIEGWNAYKPPAEENEETAKQLVKAANEVEQPSTDQPPKEEDPEDAPIAQKEESKEIEVSPTKAVEPVKPAIASSPSLKPVSSFSWADDMPDDNSDDDDYPIPADWITPKVAPPTDTTQVQETSATPLAAENDIKEPTADDSSTRFDPGDKPEEEEPELSQSARDTDPVEATATTLPTEAPKEEKPTFTWGALNDYKEPVITQSDQDDNAALNDKSPEKPDEPVQSTSNAESITTTTTSIEATLPSSPAQAAKEEAPTYTWGALNDYKEPEVTIPKAEDVEKIDKEQEEAAVAAWNSAKLPEEPEEEVAADTTNEEKMSASEEQPSWNQSVEQEKSSWGQPEQEQSSWNQPAVSSWGQADKDATESQQQPEPVPEPKPTYTWGALDDYKEPEIVAPKSEEIKIDKDQEEAAVAAWNSARLPEEPEEKADGTTLEDEKPSWNQATEEQPSWNQSTEQSWNQPTETSWNQPAKEEPTPQQQPEPVSEAKPTYTWGALNDYKEPEIVAPKSEEIKIDKDQEEAAVTAWNSARLPEEPEEKADSTTLEDEKPSWNQVTEEQPSWNQSTEPSWNQPTETSWNQPAKEEPKEEPASEPKPTYTWGALDDYKEPEVIAKPKSDTVSISKEDEKAAISAWNSVKLPEVPEPQKDESQEPVNDAPSWNAPAQNPEPVKAEPSWNANAQEAEPVKAEPSWNTTTAESSWNTDAQPTSSWGAVEQPSWSEPSTTAGSSTPQQQQQQDWSSNSFQEGSSVTSKSSYKDTWRNKLPTTVDDNAGGWKSFAETVAVPPEPAPKQRVEEPAVAAPAPAPAIAAAAAPVKSTFKRTEKGSSASKWSHDRYNGAELIHPRPSQRKPHDLSFKLNDFKEAANNEVHVSWKDIQAQDSPKISIKDDTSNRQVTVGLSEFSQANPQQDIVLRLSDITANRPMKDVDQQKQQTKQQQQQHQGPQEVVLSFSEFNKGRDGASNTWTPTNPVPTASTSDGSSSGPKEIVCKLSDFGRKDKADGPMDITLKLF